MNQPRVWEITSDLDLYGPEPPQQSVRVVELEPLLDHLAEICEEDLDSHAGQALAALLQFHGRTVEAR